MTRYSDRDIEKMLRGGEGIEPPAELLDLLRAEIPEQLGDEPLEVESLDPQAAESSFETPPTNVVPFPRRRWLAVAAAVLFAAGASVLTFRLVSPQHALQGVAEQDVAASQASPAATAEEAAAPAEMVVAREAESVIDDELRGAAGARTADAGATDARLRALARRELPPDGVASADDRGPTRDDQPSLGVLPPPLEEKVVAKKQLAAGPVDQELAEHESVEHESVEAESAAIELSLDADFASDQDLVLHDAPTSAEDLPGPRREEQLALETRSGARSEANVGSLRESRAKTDRAEAPARQRAMAESRRLESPADRPASPSPVILEAGSLWRPGSAWHEAQRLLEAGEGVDLDEVRLSALREELSVRPGLEAAGLRLLELWQVGGDRSVELEDLAEQLRQLEHDGVDDAGSMARLAELLVISTAVD